MPMRHIHEFSQSADKFEREPQGVCQALSARWIVSRALWDPRRDGEWAGGRWMGTKSGMEAHVYRIYSATRAARAAVTAEESVLMEREIRKFHGEREALVKQQRRRATNMSDLLASNDAVASAPAGYSDADLQSRLNRIHIPTLPRMLEALMNDINEHGGLDGAVHIFNDVAPEHAAHKVCGLGAGYKLIDVRDPDLSSEGGAHAIAAEVRVGETRLFDPNAGEWLSEPPGNAWEALGTLLQFLLKSVYELRAVRHLSVIHFPPKARRI